MKSKEESKFKLEAFLVGTIFLELVLVFFIFSFFSPIISGGAGGNVTVITQLQVGDVYPEIINVSIDNNAADLTLTANATKTVLCNVLVRDYNNDTDVDTVMAELFGETSSFYGDSDDNNYHYTNNSCSLNLNFGSWNGYSDDNYTALANCTFEVEYYANAETWNCTAVVNDTTNRNDTGNDDINLLELLAVGLPDSINYGTVNSTYVSLEQLANVTNVGNVELNLSLSGYAHYEGDGNAMNCSLGYLENISVMYEKYNLTTSISGPLSLSEFESNYTNLTSTPVVKEFDLGSRQNDTENEAINATYWRIYVPQGVAGTCQGNIVFGATQAAES